MAKKTVRGRDRDKPPKNNIWKKKGKTMKKAKKLIAMMLVLILTAAIGAAALATPPTYTITLNGTQEGETFRAAKVFDMTYAGTSVAYTIAQGWENFFSATGAGAAYLTDTANDYPITVGSSARYLNITQANIVEFSHKARLYAETNWSSLNANGKVDAIAAAAAPETSTVIGVPTDGYWMVYCTSAGYSDTKPGYTTTVTLTNARPTATANMKAQQPDVPQKDFTDFTLKAAEDGTHIGETVGYIVTGKVASSEGHAWHYQVFRDTMSSGLTFNQDVVVKLINPANGDEVVLYVDGGASNRLAMLTSEAEFDDATNMPDLGAIMYGANMFRVQLDTKRLNEGAVNYVNWRIEIAYSADVNENAGNTLTNDLEYGREGSYSDPYAPITPTPVAKVYTWTNKITVDKFDGSSNKIAADNTPTYTVDTSVSPMTATLTSVTLAADTPIELTGVAATVGADDYVQITYDDNGATATTWIMANAYTNTKLAGAKFVLVRKQVNGLEVNAGQSVEILDNNLTTANVVATAAEGSRMTLLGLGKSTEWLGTAPNFVETEFEWYMVDYNGTVGYVLKDASKLSEKKIDLANEEFYRYDTTTNTVSWVTDVNNATVLTTTVNITDNMFNGLKDGTYYLRETEAPTGFNMLPGDIQVDVAHGVTNNIPNGVNVIKPVANNGGAQLPETGGIGTTIFYVLGGILLVGSSVVLVTRRRMGSSSRNY